MGFIGLCNRAWPIWDIPICLPFPIRAWSPPEYCLASVMCLNSGVKWCVAPESIYQELSDDWEERPVGIAKVVSIAEIGELVWLGPFGFQAVAFGKTGGW